MDHPDLIRVESKIGDVVKEFCRERLNKSFTSEELRAYVIKHAPESAPASSDRILRDLRQKGELSYTLLSRSESLYQVNSVTP